jgi:hypothetical protein
LGEGETNLDNVQSLVDTGLGVEREAGIDLGGHLAGDDFEDLLAELNQESVEGGIDLRVDVLVGLLGLCVCDSNVDELGGFNLLGSGEDDSRVCSGVLRLVLGDGGKITLVRGLEWSLGRG